MAEALWKTIVSRLVPWWITVGAAAWTVSFLYAWIDESTSATMTATMGKIMKGVGITNTELLTWGSTYIGVLLPIYWAATIAAFLLTDRKLPNWRLSWMHQVFQTIYPFRNADYGMDLARKNQFGVGDLNFNVLSFVIIAVPGLIQFAFFLPISFTYVDPDAEKSIAQQKTKNASYLISWVAILFWVWFLIPVARHSVLLTALGWSPVQGLRLHVWSGYLSFVCAMIHSLMEPLQWIIWGKIVWYRNFIPPAGCWAWNPDLPERHPANETEQEELPEDSADAYKALCQMQWYNLTGILAIVPFLVLVFSSLNWFRRRNYRLFYILHIVFGSLTLIFTVLHMAFVAVYLAPALAYYFASTSPTLIQALVSMRRGGSKVVKVVALEDAGGCCEVLINTTPESQEQLRNEACLYVKLCVPTISLVWHPFTVYGYPDDPSTVRFLFRPVGPFTKDLATELFKSPRPITLIDGYYKGPDRVGQALNHDHITIITGGIAITPFLSFLHQLADRSKKSQDRVITKGLALHWSCREAGLAQYVWAKYVGPYLTELAELGWNVSANVYCTGEQFSLTDGRILEAASKMEKKVYSSERSSTQEETERSFTLKMKFEMEVDVDDPTTWHTESSEVVYAKDDSSDKGFDLATPGHAMEVPRMLPGRYSSFTRNLPYAIVFSGFWWLYFHMMVFSYEDRYKLAGYHDLVDAALIMIVVVMMSFGCSAILEFFVLHFRHLFKDLPINLEVEFERVACTPMYTDHLVVKVGRPGAWEMLADARKATCPGIFLCGPTGITDAVWKEVRKENSFFLRTRYCVYDESFEM